MILLFISKSSMDVGWHCAPILFVQCHPKVQPLFFQSIPISIIFCINVIRPRIPSIFPWIINFSVLYLSDRSSYIQWSLIYVFSLNTYNFCFFTYSFYDIFGRYVVYPRYSQNSSIAPMLLTFAYGLCLSPCYHSLFIYYYLTQ